MEMKNRKIKFRVFYNGNMHYAEFSQFYSYGAGVLFDIPFRDLTNITQFTGLYDNNGEEIYEGDILMNPEKELKYPREKYPYSIVEWKKAGWVATGYNGQIKVSPSLYYRKDLKVIGNIYENPELLEK